MWGRADAGQLGIAPEFLSEDSMGKVCTIPMHISHFSRMGRRVK